ncbi:MAG: nitrate reductase subunit alpha [Chloroflexi bacterium]|nr:nitrate reductase subunit alpha [Chloroflexota bacterium]
MGWVSEIVNPETRRWEELYRNRWQHDKVVRSTHGVNCTGGCSWNVYVKDGIVTWEMQATDYPKLGADVPPYEPRGCQRGISFSWYLYSPIRVKYPYGRGALLDLWRKAKAQHADPVEAWASIMADPERRRSYQQARGKGGFRRISWDEALEIVTASTLHTMKTYGPDRVIGFSPIPAMSMLSYAAGSRFLQLLGGVVMSFYDWYCDLPPASPEVWGEQTDVAESADWFHSKYVAVMGSNPAMTRTPDAHFLSEARANGAKHVIFAPDFNQAAKHADWWVPINAGQDGAFWMAANHVILKEFHADQPTPYFLDYVKRYTDSPFLVVLDKHAESYRPGRLLRASQLAQYQGEENAETKFLVVDAATGAIKMPQGTLGFRWQQRKGQWNLDLKDGHDGSDLDPALTLLDAHDAVEMVAFREYAFDRTFQRGVPVRTVETLDGLVTVATIYDLLMAQFGVGRGLPGDYPGDYDDEDAPYTPAWQERFTGIDRQTVIQFAREWSATAERSEGQCSIIIGAGVNHWYHNNLIYRAAIAALMLTGCVGRNGGGLNHYVGQEKLAPMAAWLPVAMALDWGGPPRLQNTPSFHYVHSDQWRYEGAFADLAPVGDADHPLTQGHTMDLQRRAVRAGWLPFFPQFNRNPLELVQEAEAAGATTPDAIKQWVVEQLQSGALQFAIDDPDAPENWPRTWFIWRGNALQSSAKGHEYFLKHYLGTHTNAIAEDVSGAGEAPEGKLDLVVDINFRMDTSALYSDIVLPAATWYEKDDLNTTDLHSYIHPLSEVVPPCWESRSDWDIFKALAREISELSARHFPRPVRDLVAAPLQHDTPAELAQLEVKDWAAGECPPIPGETMPNFTVVERDYANLYNRFISLGTNVRNNGLSIHGVRWPVTDLYDELCRDRPAISWNSARYPSLAEADEAANAILWLAPETNGESAYRAFKAEEEKVGLPLADLAEKTRGVRMTFEDLTRQPRRVLTSPAWTGIVNEGRTYSAYCLNVERLVPWRTLTGRQHFYLDHEGYIAFGEHLPTYKPKIDPHAHGDILRTEAVEGSIMLNYLTPHGKWQIHSTYSDNLRMRTLSRGVDPIWMNVDDALAIGIDDNDWVEVFNDHGVMVTRAIVTARIPRGLCFIYHATERTLSIPKSPLRGGRRAGGHNSLTRTRLKPNLLFGGYGQFTYGFNYWGPTGVNRDTFVLVRKLDGEPRW